MDIVNEIKAADLLTGLDLFAFGMIIVITIACVIYGNHRATKGGDSFLDHFLMGRQLTLPLFVGTLVATWYGGIFGVTKIAFESGIYMFVTQGFFWYVSYILFALFIVPKVQASDAITLPELVGKMFGKKASYVAAVFNFMNVLPIAYALSLGIFLNLIFDISVPVGTFLGTLGVCAYSWWGGFRAVVFSDLVQFFTMCFSVALVVYFSITNFGGLDYLRTNLPETFFDPTGGYTFSTTLVWGLIALSTLVDPNFYQRCFAAKSSQVARNGIFASTLIWCAFDLCTTFGSMYAAAVIPDAVSRHAYLTYALQILPDGLRGLFLAGILCTILSTLDSYNFVASNTLTYDLAPEKWRRNVWLNRGGILGVGLVASLASMAFEDSVEGVWKTFGSYSAGCLLFPVLLGYIAPKKVTETGFLLGCGAGVIAISVWRNIELSGFWANVDDLYMGVLASFLGVVLGGFLPQRAEVEA